MKAEGDERVKRRLRLRRIALLCVAAIACGALAVLVVGGRVRDAYESRHYGAVRDVPASDVPRVAIVFGAGVWRGGEPSPVLYDRLETAAELYRAGLVQKLLLTGDNRVANYNEPAVMRLTLERMGIPSDALVEDFAGRRTYDSCYRAVEIFGVRDAVLVTQEFHLARALYTCNQLGVASIGVRADRQTYGGRSRVWWRVRERLALASAWLDVNVLRPVPILGEREPIAINATEKIGHAGNTGLFAQ